MSEVEVCETPSAAELSSAPKATVKVKREIVRFSGKNPSAINLDHVRKIAVEGRRVFFWFYEKEPESIDCDDEASALSAFEVFLGIWVSEAK